MPKVRTFTTSLCSTNSEPSPLKIETFSGSHTASEEAQNQARALVPAAFAGYLFPQVFTLSFSGYFNGTLEFYFLRLYPTPPCPSAAGENQAHCNAHCQCESEEHRAGNHADNHYFLSNRSVFGLKQITHFSSPWLAGMERSLAPTAWRQVQSSSLRKLNMRCNFFMRFWIVIYCVPLLCRETGMSHLKGNRISI